MKAVYFEKLGGPEVLTYGDLPDPVAAAEVISHLGARPEVDLRALVTEKVPT